MSPPTPDAGARAAAWNAHGTLLAAGRGDGRVAVYDMDTRGVARLVEAHR